MKEFQISKQRCTECFISCPSFNFLISCLMQGFAVPKEVQDKVAKFSFHGQPAELKHGSVVIAAITSCTNTSNPSVMLGAALVAKKACELGLKVGLHLFICFFFFSHIALQVGFFLVCGVTFSLLFCNLWIKWTFLNDYRSSHG